MSELSTGLTETSPPVVEFAPPDIARRHIATWNGLQTDAVEVIRREPFAYEYKASRHLLIMCERAERDDGETLVKVCRDQPCTSTVTSSASSRPAISFRGGRNLAR